MSVEPRDSQSTAVLLNAKASQIQGKSLDAFLASLCTGVIIFVAELTFYCFLRTKLPEQYIPQSRGPLRTTGADIVEKQGVDAYLFLRYLKMLLRIFLPLAVVISPVLCAVNYLAGTVGASGLDRISWSNIDADHIRYYWIHLCFSVVLVGWVCRVVWFEIRNLLQIRQSQMMIKASMPSGRTILVTDIPREWRTENRLRQIFGPFQGGIQSVRIHRDNQSLQAKVEERDRLVHALEEAESRLIIRGLLLRRKEPDGGHIWERGCSAREVCRLPILPSRWCPVIPFLGRGVDAIDHYRERLSLINREIKSTQQDGNLERETSALIEFKDARGAQMACRSIPLALPHRMRPVQLAASSRHVLWKNVSLLWWQRYMRNTMVTLGAISACGACVIPVAFTGAVSQLNYLVTLWAWLSWLKRLPSWIQGIVQGVMPPAFLAIITILLPILLERLMQERDVTTDTQVELLVQRYYFAFLFLQVFLVVSVVSGIAAVLAGKVHTTRSTAAVIARDLPKASNYFLSYILLQGLSVSGGSLLQLSTLFGHICARWTDRTPRRIWQRRMNSRVKWGMYFPVYTNIAAIGLIYSTVSPLILVVTVFSFFLLFVVQRYIILNGPQVRSDTGGLVFLQAVNQLFVGLYTMEMYLTGLFFLVRDRRGRPACVGQAIIMLVVLGGTFGFQVLLNRSYQPLFHTLPLVPETAPSEQAVEPIQPHKRGLAAWLGCVLQHLEIWENVLGHPSADLQRSRTIPVATHENLDRQVDELPVEDFNLQSAQPTVWIPCDELGLSKRAIYETRDLKEISISDENASVTPDGHLICTGDPPPS